MANADIPYGAASRIAGEVDSVYIFITVIAVIFFLVTQGLLIYFALKYRKRKGEEERETPYITTNRILEGIWVAIPTLLVMSIFAYGYKVWDDIRTPLPNAEEINVTARQWLFKFKYPDGRTAVNEVRVPAGQPVEFVMTSEDVLHGFFIPEMRVKQDILPGRYTYLWVKPEKAGTYTIFCTQYCGVGHSGMLARLVVMPQAEYEAWASAQMEAQEKTMPLADKGKALVDRFGCLACHTADGTVKVGPTFKGLFGSRVTLSDGSAVTADEDYVKESILYPAAKVVKGYKPVMPTFKGLVTDEDITAIIAYIKSLSGAPAPKEKEAAMPPATRLSPGQLEAKGKALAQSSGCLACHTLDGTPKAGPTLKGLYGSMVTLSDGSRVKADDAYIRESIYDPGAKIVKGYQNIMPPFKDTLSEEDVQALMEYIKTVR